jgi:catechol 2,3-dioxygenase-like lactoylglutathione lyase family enzyme
MKISSLSVFGDQIASRPPTERVELVTGAGAGFGARSPWGAVFSQLILEVFMELGAFSVSLAVKDLEQSKAFYEKLGFDVFGGDQSQNWLIMKNGGHVIGLFQGMFPNNILTFNPGWDSDANRLEDFTDVRELQRRLKGSGIEFASEADESCTGPASFMIVDPDGNTILVDQHV